MGSDREKYGGAIAVTRIVAAFFVLIGLFMVARGLIAVTG